MLADWEIGYLPHLRKRTQYNIYRSGDQNEGLGTRTNQFTKKMGEQALDWKKSTQIFQRLGVAQAAVTERWP